MSKLDTLRAYLAKSPGDSFLQHAMALEYIKLGNDAEAKTLFESILTTDPRYTGSYYHLGRLLERNGLMQEALIVYGQGMAACREAGENHAYNELQAAYEDLEDNLSA